jgi:flavin reductase (DIM6/NTAB) family NADH-FMN oxidoreductase RutF/rubredoxin
MNLQALQKLGYGLYVVCSRKGDRLNGQIANTIFQISSEPPTIAVALNKKNLTHEFIDESKVFTGSILSQETPLSFIGHFGFKSGREGDKLKDTVYRLGVSKAPVVLDHALAYLEARVVHQFEVGTHTVFVGEIVEADVLQEGEPMTYAYYHQVKRGTTPKEAPSYIKTERTVPHGTRQRCTICGYTYDQAKGDPDGGIKPGTPFEEIPGSWICPICGATKDLFEKVAA